MKKVLLLIAIFNFAYLQECYNVGNDVEFSGTSNHSPNYINGMKFTLEQDAYIDYLNVIGKEAGANFQLALYSDDGNRSVSELILNTEIATIQVGVNQLPVESTLLEAGDYWIMSIFETMGHIGIEFGTENTVEWIAHNFGDPLPETFIPESYTGQEFNFFMTLNCSQSPFIEGCTDDTALNFNSEATNDDGSCEYASGITITDIDGNVYETVQIGDQLWMAENLKVTHYQNGDPITHTSNNDDWQNNGDWADVEGKYGAYNNDPLNSENYGNLYNWYVGVDERGVCPDGWHVPSDEEIKELEMFLGMVQSEADGMGYRGTNEGSKIAGSDEMWNNGSLVQNDQFGNSGLNIQPTGFRNHSNGNYEHFGNYGFIWSSTEVNEYYAWHRDLYFNYTDISRWTYYKTTGLSIRCIGDEGATGSTDIEGCTDDTACNYNAEATVDDGSCLELDCAGDCGGIAVVDLCGDCGGDGSSCSGCIDPYALNFDPTATIDDDSCTYPSSESVVWKFDITAEMVNMAGEHLIDQFNRIGFYYGSQEEASENGQVEPLPEASDLFDSFWDVPEPFYANPANEIHFYVENDWSELTGWGQKWAYDIRELNDDYYASNNTTVFNGIVVAELGGYGTLNISPGGDTKLTDDNDTYVPVYAKVTGGGHNGDYYKIEGETTIPLELGSNEEVSVDFIVGNLVPEAADNLVISTATSDDAEGSEWKPFNIFEFDTDAACDDVSLTGVDYDDLNGQDNYDLIRCNDYEQRYPANQYNATSYYVHDDSELSLVEYLDIEKDSHISETEFSLMFDSEYITSLVATNDAGTGASTTTSITTVGNLNPGFSDLCTNDGNYNNDCESLIESSAVGHDGSSLSEADEIGLITDESDDLHLYHTYTPIHDGCGQLGGCGENGDESGTDLDGLDQSGTPITVTLNSAYSDHEGYLLDANWSGDLDFNSESSFENGNSSSVSFVATEPNSGTGSSFTFDLEITDNEWITNQTNGLNSNSTSITVTVLPEPNENPVAKITVPVGQLDQDGGAYWQVPHNGDNEYTCDDLLPFDEQDCDDNKAEVTLSYVDSFDPDCVGQDDHCEEYDHWWSEALMGLTYNDMNYNGYFDEGEPCSDENECLWSFNSAGFAPDVNDGELSHADEHSQRVSGGGGYIWTVTVQDNYGATNTSARGFYVLPEPNTRAYANTASDATSGFEVDSNSGEGSDDDFHYIPEGESTTNVSLNEGLVSDFDGDDMSFTTTLNGELVYSGTCNNACYTPGFDRDLGVGEYTVETCVVDSYEGYEYLLYAQETGVDQSIEVTQNDPHCDSFTFSVLPEPAPVHVSSLSATNQGLSSISMSWNPSDFTNYPNDEDHAEYTQLDEYGENAVHYIIERTENAEDVESWEEITEVLIIREYATLDCDGKEEDYENYLDGCEDPTIAEADDAGEWYYMGFDENDGKFHFLDEGLEPNTTYHYRMFAVNSHGTASKIGNVLTHSTEAKPELSFDRDMAAEIYAVGELTNPLTAIFTAADGLAGHNLTHVSSSYTTYEGTTNHESIFSGDGGIHANGPGSIDFSYTVTAWETDHGQSIEVCYEDAGDYWGYNREGGCLTTATFTGSQEVLHNDYNYNGWHMFGMPLIRATSMVDLFSMGFPEYNLGSDFVWFTESGGFGPTVMYNFGKAYVLGLNPYLSSFNIEGSILTSVINDDGTNNVSVAGGHELVKGWNLISPKLVRPVDVHMLTITDEGGTHDWDEAHSLGIVSGELLKMGQYGFYQTDSYSPWGGYWVHASRDCYLGVEPHSFDLTRDQKEDEYFSWNLNIEATPVDGEGFGDIIKVGISENASDEFKDGEDTEDIPVMTMMDKYLDLFMIDENDNRYWKNTKSMINSDQSQAWIIQGDAINTNSDVRLNWTMDELPEEYKVRLFIKGEAIDMRSETEIIVQSNEISHLTIVVGSDPLSSNLITPTEFSLSDAYPNPFNPVTSMQLSLDANAIVSVKVYNIMGQIIDEIQNGYLEAGYHQLSWNASDKIPSGTYIIKASYDNVETSQKVLLMK